MPDLSGVAVHDAPIPAQCVHVGWEAGFEDVWSDYLETIAALESIANTQKVGVASPPWDPDAMEHVGREFTRVARMANARRGPHDVDDGDHLPVSGGTPPEEFFARRER